jgi:hypothetical protein
MAIPLGIGAAIAGGVASAGTGALLGGLFGGGGGGGGGQQPGDVYAAFAAQMAAQNNPLTAAYQGLSLLQGALAGAIGQERLKLPLN